MTRPSLFESLLVWYGRRFPIRRGKMRMIDLLWRAATGDRTTERLAVLKHGGFKMPCDVGEMLQRQFYFTGTYLLDAEVLDCWEREARSANVVFDVGANVGMFSLAALAVQPQAVVHAFEPTPEIAAALRRTASLNGLGRLYVHEVAIHAHNGKAVLRRYRGDRGTNGGMNFVSTTVGDPTGEFVHTVCLDDFCDERKIDRVDLLKLDIQGNEHQALAGAARLLAAGRITTIVTELNWSADGAASPATESIRILEQAGYLFAKPGERLHWRRSGSWLFALSDVIARRSDADGNGRSQ